MGNTFVVDMTHFLDEHGEMSAELPGPARRLAEYFVAIVTMASYPEPDYPAKYRVLCRRRPNRRKCLEEIVGFVDPETDDIVWMCPRCHDNGIISNWRNTMWDMSGFDEVGH
jgi:hypothetical protein